MTRRAGSGSSILRGIGRLQRSDVERKSGKLTDRKAVIRDIETGCLERPVYVSGFTIEFVSMEVD
jgi:hypothetical protein